jgi:hypothetical protein
MSKLAVFSVELISEYVESDEGYPVPFDGLWQKVGYARKDTAVEYLKREFIEGVDFYSGESRNRRSGKASAVFHLTADAAKVFAVRARTPEGVVIAKLFVAAYGELKAKIRSLEELHKTQPIWQQARLQGKSTRRTFTDAIQDYIDRHRSELSPNAIKWMYINASEQVNLVVFGRKAKRLADDLQIPPQVLRDGMTSEELQLLREVENTSMRMVDRLDMNPLEAVKAAGVNLLIPVQSRSVAQLKPVS